MQPEETLAPSSPDTESSEEAQPVTKEQPQNANEVKSEGTTSTRKRIPRGAAPPILTLDEAASIVTRFYEDAGGEASYDPLSSITGNSSGSSVFLKKLATLKNYDLILDENRLVILTPLGFRVAAPHDPIDRVQALKEAFLNVEVFEKVYERYKGRILPQDEFLVNAFTAYVPRELAAEWMDRFKASAAIAGLLEERNGKFQVRESVRVPDWQETPTDEILKDLSAPVNMPVQPQIEPVTAPIPAPIPRSESPYDVLIRILSPDMDDDEQQAVWTLIRYLKKQEAK